MDASLFIKSMTTDEEGRIVVAVQDMLKEHLKDDNTRNMLKEATKKALGDDYKKLEVSHATFRVTVTPGKSEEAKLLIEQEIANQIQMAMQLMQQFGQQEE